MELLLAAAAYTLTGIVLIVVVFGAVSALCSTLEWMHQHIPRAYGPAVEWLWLMHPLLYPLGLALLVIAAARFFHP